MITNPIIVQIYDSAGDDRTTARFIGFDKPNLHASQFVIIECGVSKRSFLGVVVGPNLNFNRNSLSPTDNTAINQIEMITYGRMVRDVAINEIFYYEVLLIREIIDGAPESVRVRPRIGALCRSATVTEVTTLLGLPAADPDTQIGLLVDMPVPVCVSKKVL